MKLGILKEINNAAKTADYLAQPRLLRPSTKDDFVRSKKATTKVDGSCVYRDKVWSRCK